jgi:SAM-dependent methyltransferase
MVYPMSNLGTRDGAPESERINEQVWRHGDFVSAYATRTLYPAEVMLLVQFREALSKRVLELGCGAGRVTSYLIELGGEVVGADISPRMVQHCEVTMKRGRFMVADLKHLETFASESRDAIVMASNLIDVLEDGERQRALVEMRRMLAPGGLLLMSSHNLAYAGRIATPLGALRACGVVGAVRRAPRLPLWILNHTRLRRLERRRAGHALLNDEAHDFRLLHYYVDRDTQERQFRQAGLTPVACIDAEGHPLEPGERAGASSSLHYVARREE